MSITPINSAASTPVRYTPPAPIAQRSEGSGTEEATETAAETRNEAAHGDQAALRKLAKQDQAQQSAPASTTARNAAGSVDVVA